jgi:molybdopterin-guanine dinucleotide biosynthesis protein A
MATAPLLAVVMCGGQSRRMGTDKGSIKIGDNTWAGTILNLFTELQLPAVISINASQQAVYQTLFPNTPLITDSAEANGPLRGLLSVHQQFPKSDLLVVACDMVYMQTQTLMHLINSYNTAAGYDFYAYHNGQFYEPLCAIYTCNALSYLWGQANNGLINNHSLQQVLKSNHTKALSVTGSYESSFQNLNRA